MKTNRSSKTIHSPHSKHSHLQNHNNYHVRGSLNGKGAFRETSSIAIIPTSLAYLQKVLYHTRTSAQDVVQLFGSILEREPAVRGCLEVRVPDGQVGPRPTVLSNQVRKYPAKRSRSIQSDSPPGYGEHPRLSTPQNRLLSTPSQPPILSKCTTTPNQTRISKGD